jgi:hypothetical protein
MTLLFLNSNRRGQGTVENLMMTAIIAGLLMPIVYKVVISPLMTTMQGQKRKLVDFVAQNNKQTVPSAWFASERMQKIKEDKTIDKPKDIESPEIPEPGQIPESKEIKPGKEIKSAEIKPPKDIPPPKPIGGGGGTGGGGAGGASGSGSALGGSAKDPDFFSGEGNKDASASNDKQGGAGGKDGGSRRGDFDEYSPRGSRTGDQKSAPQGKEQLTKKTGEANADSKNRQSMLLNETREDERARERPFNWWLLIKFLVIAFIIFLVILIGLSNMKKR